MSPTFDPNKPLLKKQQWRVTREGHIGHIDGSRYHCEAVNSINLVANLPASARLGIDPWGKTAWIFYRDWKQIYLVTSGVKYMRAADEFNGKTYNANEFHPYTIRLEFVGPMKIKKVAEKTKEKIRDRKRKYDLERRAAGIVPVRRDTPHRIFMRGA